MFALLRADAQTVQFQLRNGDRVSGEIGAETADGLTLKTPWGGTIGVPAKEIVSGRLIPAPANGSVPPAVLTPVAMPSPQGAPPTKIHKWIGEIQAGVDLLFSERNRELYSGRAKITHTYGLLRNLFDYQFTYGESEDELTDNRMFASLKTDVDLNRRLYVYNLGGAAYDEIRKIDFQWETGPGLGYRWLKRTNIVFNTEAGFNYQAQYLEDNVEKKILYLRLAEDATWKITPKLSIDEKFEYFPSTEDFSNYRMRLESNLRYAIVNNLSFIVTVLDTYETETAQGVPRNDLQIRSSIGVKF
jgi:putative salt-induced outer membrane protein YdiY